MGKWVWCLWIITALCSGLSATDAPEFKIETIRINGANNVSEAVIRSQAQLDLGESYNERQLRNAIQAINRLPFILETEMALEKGSERGLYQLVITVKTATNWFYNLETVYTRDFRGTGYLDDFDLGWRWFVGKSSMIFAAIQPGANLLQDAENIPVYTMGFSEYDFLGKGIFLNLTLNYADPTEITLSSSRSESNLIFDDPFTPQFNLAIPLKGNQWLKSELSSATTKLTTIGTNFLNEPFENESTLESLKGRIFWEFNTTNDNFLPTRGSLIRGGLGYLDEDLDVIAISGAASDRTRESKLLVALGSYRRYREFNARHAWNWGVSVDYGYEWVDGTGSQINGEPFSFTQSRDTTTGARLELGYTMDVWGRERTHRLGDLRFQALLTAGNSELERPFLEREDEVGLILDLTLRNRWGLIRIGVNIQEF